MKYDPSSIEPSWQKKWAEEKINQAQDFSDREKFYVLDMFPYPSGDGLHVGHAEGYTATDIFSRYLRARGYNVLHPMGWDAFGLPAENYAIKKKVHPRIITKKNVDYFRKQIQKLGFSYDWEREVNTTDPDYYRWTQWIFLQIFKKGLAYEDIIPINWCPSCQTGIANEEVVNGECERCHTKVVKKDMKQWILRITEYADRLLKDLDLLDWPEKIKDMQRHWIGRSEGYEVTFAISGHSQKIKVYTTRIDTLNGATFMVLAPEHQLLKKIVTAEQRAAVSAYQEKAREKSDLEREALEKEKTGVFTGAYAVNPVNGEEIPIWVADYVMMNYGAGAIMAVPAHDERDFQFAKKYKLPIIPVIQEETSPNITGVGALIETPSGKFVFQKRDQSTKRYPGMIAPFGGGIEKKETPEQAVIRELAEELGIKVAAPMVIGDFASHFDKKSSLRMFHVTLSPADTALQVNEGVGYAELTLAEALQENKVTDFTKQVVRKFSGQSDELCVGDGILINSGEFDGLSVNAAKVKIATRVGAKKKINYKLRDWVFSRQRYWGEPIPVVHCKHCGIVPVPEKDLPVTLPAVEKYEPTGTGESPLAAISEWVNTTCPECGGPAKRETNTMPQWAGSCWYYLRYIDPKNKQAVFDKKKMQYWCPVDMYVGGAEHAVLHLLYARFWHKVLYDEGWVDHPEPFLKLRNQGMILGPDGSKMSKSRGNVINPDAVVREYGADAFRLYEMFMGPFADDKPWNTKGIIGTRRFLERVWDMSLTAVTNQTVAKAPAKLTGDLASLLNKTIKKVGEDIPEFRFNTAIAAMMSFLNEAQKYKVTSLPAALARSFWEPFLQILAPFAPHIAEELWSKFGHNDSIFKSPWPEFDPDLVRADNFELVVQVNGKVRAKLMVSADISEAEALTAAKADAKIKPWLENKKIIKEIYIAGRLVNLVVRDK